MLTLDDLGNAPSTHRPSLVDDAYRALKDAIRENVFPPGYQGSEQEIASRLGMSRTPVHEAVIRLQEEGLVRVLTRRGVLVCTVSPGRHARDLRRHHRAGGHGGRAAGRPAGGRSGRPAWPSSPGRTRPCARPWSATT